MIRKRLVLLGALIVLGVVSACGDSGPTGDEPLPDVGPLLTDTATAMLGISSVGYSIEPKGGPVFFNLGLDLEFIEGSGSYAAPSSAESQLRLKVGGALFEVMSIAIGEQVWVTEPLTGSWNQLGTGSGFNPAILFDNETGIAQLLSEDLSDGAVAGVVGHSGRDHYQVTGTVSGERVETITFGLAGGQSVPIVLLIDTETMLISNAAFSTVSDSLTTDWSLDFFDYDEPVTIEPPNG